MDLSNIFADVMQLPIPAEEALPEINTHEFVKVVESRRSVRFFSNAEIPDSVMNKCLDLALLAPSSSNFCPWEFYWVKTPEKRKQLNYCCMNSPIATGAAELVVCVVRTEVWRRNRSAMLEILKKSEFAWPRFIGFYYEKLTWMTYIRGYLNIIGTLKSLLLRFLRLFSPQALPPCSRNDMRLWATKSGALAAENFMLALRAFGYDSCALESFDQKRTRQLLQLPADAFVIMVIAAGKRSPRDQLLGPRVRFERAWHVKQV